MTAALEETRPTREAAAPGCRASEAQARRDHWRRLCRDRGGAGLETMRCRSRSDRSAQSSHLSAAALPSGDRGSRARRDRRADPSARGEAKESHGDAGRSHGRRFECPLGRRVSYPASGAHKIAFDFLIIAAGMQPSYFGHDEFARYAPGLKNLSDAETIRTKILSAYETGGADGRRQRTLRGR